MCFIIKLPVEVENQNLRVFLEVIGKNYKIKNLLKKKQIEQLSNDKSIFFLKFEEYLSGNFPVFSTMRPSGRLNTRRKKSRERVQAFFQNS